MGTSSEGNTLKKAQEAVADAHVILLNRNQATDTLECLETLIKQEGVRLHIIVVDNGSKDDSVQRIHDCFPQVQVIEGQKNLGFQGGNNAGIRDALEQGAKTIFILNNDTLAAPNMVRLLLDQLTPDVGAVTPAIFYASDPGVIWSIGGKINPVFLEMTAPHGGHIPLPSEPEDRDFLTGCAILAHADVFRQVGLFEEKFHPIYYEDLDLCLRIRRRGLRMRLVPQAHLWHKVSKASGGQHHPRVYFLMARNSGIYFRKHMRVWQAPFIITYRFLSAVKTSGLLIWRRDGQGLKAYWIGLANGWTGRLLKAGAPYLAYYR